MDPGSVAGSICNGGSNSHVTPTLNAYTIPIGNRVVNACNEDRYYETLCKYKKGKNRPPSVNITSLILERKCLENKNTRKNRNVRICVREEKLSLL